MTTTTDDTFTAYIRIIRRNKADLQVGPATITDPSWETLHSTRHAIAGMYGVDPMSVDIYNVRDDQHGTYVGGFDPHNGCEMCKWDQARY